MFGSLRTKLIASYALVITLSLLLAGLGSVYLIRSYQTQLRLNQLADQALPLTLQLWRLEHLGASPSEIQQILKEQASDLGLRLLLVDARHRIVADTGGTLVGQFLPSPSNERPRQRFAMQWGTMRPPNEGPLTFVLVHTGPAIDRPRASNDDLVLAVPEQSVTTAWMQLSPGLIGAAILAMLISTGVAVWLARSISRPLAQVTQASERMARGDFEQFIDAKGSDEVGQLARSFNAMAREVGQMHRTMRDLLANVSHELRTPLTSIEGFSQAMLDGTIKTPEEYRDAARIIGEEAERMHRLVEDLLYLSKIESGQIHLEQKVLDIPELLRTCVRQVQLQASQAGCSVELEAQPVPRVVGDSHRLQQVFVNLLDNAVKHTPSGGRVTVHAYAEPAGQSPSDDGRSGRRKSAPSWIAVEVHNTGSHIPPEHLPRIFDRFYRVDRSRADDGTGLGLAIVREIVQAHDGRVTVKSDATHGTTFTVYLPSAA